MRRFLVLLAFFVLLPAQAAPPVPQKGPLVDGGPAVTFDGKNIVVSGPAAGETVYGAGMEVRGSAYGLGIESRVASAAIGADGKARLDMEKNVTVRSIWVVVDSKGGYTVTPGPGMVMRQMDLPGSPAAAGADGQVRHLAFKRSSVFVFVIRPGTGIWSARMWDGHLNDEDGKINGSVSSPLQGMQAIGKTPGAVPDHLMPGDVLFVVDPYSLEFAVARMGR